MRTLLKRRLRETRPVDCATRGICSTELDFVGSDLSQTSTEASTTVEAADICERVYGLHGR